MVLLCVPASIAGTFLYTVPVFAVVIAWLWLGEVPGALGVVGRRVGGHGCDRGEHTGTEGLIGSPITQSRLTKDLWKWWRMVFDAW